jgi:hypothetical protein
MWKSNSPCGVVVSICSVGDRKPTPLSLNPVTMVSRCDKKRPRQSSFQTIRQSPGRAKWSTFASPGRSSRAPLALVSMEAIKRLGLRPRCGHLDSTSFHVDGQYNSGHEPEVGVIHITQGDSRDHGLWGATEKLWKAFHNCSIALENVPQRSLAVPPFLEFDKGVMLWNPAVFSQAPRRAPSATGETTSDDCIQSAPVNACLSPGNNLRQPHLTWPYRTTSLTS